MNPSVTMSVRTFATKRFRIAAMLLGVMLGVTGQARSGTVILDFDGGGLTGAGNNLTTGWTFTLSAKTTVGGLAIWTPATSVVQSHQVGLWGRKRSAARQHDDYRVGDHVGPLDGGSRREVARKPDLPPDLNHGSNLYPRRFLREWQPR